MRLFGYYAWHSFVNQLRKLFKTWVLIFLVVCIAIGALIGFGAAMLDDAAGEDEEIIDSEVIEEEEPGIQEQLGIEPMELVELIVGGVILAVFVFGAISADKNGSRIFLPADVNLLFASPMKPQSVLLFRLMTQLGTSILASVYLLFQLPNLVLGLGLSIWVALAMIARDRFPVSARPAGKEGIKCSLTIPLQICSLAFAMLKSPSMTLWWFRLPT